ncbi:excalibur calcium-binding domain-containing protein [Actinophytocola oryzae]|uniref:Excalibur calcium-binding domain-containing protein n=1 Tax=Actinophytocola oryzae TaxID=502181 RepID=A0A4R7W200_9PSEU|nr:excalibur calcium-binding domain-containing protein [Actinophytocola oryzae]TDV56623.1 excalibur calcium-binding domain-containing protein [Actinophytocola oryzae]
MSSGQVERSSLRQWWRSRKRKWPWVVAALVLILFVIAGMFGDPAKKPGETPADKPAMAIPGGLTGMDAASARDRLEALGFGVTIESVDGRAVIVEGNWLVVSAEHRAGGSADDILLRVEKPTEPTTTTTQPPAVVEAPPVTQAPPVTATPPVEVAPVPEQPAEPPSAYYANCAAARAAGAAPLHAGEPGYRAGLDRDGDGVACEK